MAAGLPAAVAWAGWPGWLELAGTWAAFLASAWAVGILTVLAIAELVADQLPSTSSRKVPVQFGGRLAPGASPVRRLPPSLAPLCSAFWRRLSLDWEAFHALRQA